MTVSTTTTETTYTGDGVTVAFATGFQFLENTDLVVTRTVIATGVETTLTLNSTGANGFSVTGAGGLTGGTVTVVTPPGYATETLTIRRVVPVTQEQNYTPNDPLPAETLERALDKLTMLAQQALAEIAETGAGLPAFPPSDPLKVIGWNSDGDLDNLVIGDPGDLVISAFMDTFLQAADAAAARAGLGLGTFATVTPTGSGTTANFLRGDNSYTDGLTNSGSSDGTLRSRITLIAGNSGIGDAIAEFRAINSTSGAEVNVRAKKNGDAYVEAVGAPLGLRGNGAASDVAQVTDDNLFIGSEQVGISRVLWETQNGAYGFTSADFEARKGFRKTDNSTPTWTIPANGSDPIPVGTVFPVANLGGSGSITVAITSDTLQLSGGTTTGSRTFAPGALGGIVKVDSTRWFAFGSGVT